MESLKITSISDEGHDVIHGNQRQAILWAYFAGLIDGEGSFVIQRTAVEKIAKSCKCVSPKYLAYFCIGMVDKAPLDLIRDTIGAGKVYEECVPDRRSIWRIRFGGRVTLMPFIRNLIPHLIVKKKQAELLLDFCEKWVSPKNENGKRARVSDQELQRREEAYQKMRKLNAVGAAATTKSRGIREDEAIV